MLEHTHFLDHALTTLPHRPYCSDDLADGLRIRPLATAKKHRYLQINPPSQAHYLIFDVDRPMAAYAWEDNNLAPPNFATVNPKNGHAHLVYKLSAPVTTNANGTLKPLRYLAAIERAYSLELGADAGYSGLITRNPYKHPTLCLHTDAYGLDELADWLKGDLGLYPDKKELVSGLGRNVTLFDTVRAWAYQAIRLYRTQGRAKLYDVWFMEIYEYAITVNAQYPAPLQLSEVRATTRSIAKYCWKQDGEAEQRFIERQAARGKAGGIAKGRVNAEKRLQALELRNQGMSYTKVAEALSVSRRSIINWCK